MNTANYMNILGAKIKEAQGQLSAQAQRYITNECDGDLYMGAMSYTYEIEERYYCNESDDSDYNILMNIMNLIDIIMELDFENEDFYEDALIVIDED